MMNVEQARFNMIEQQIRPWDVLDQNVLDLLYKVRREQFVPAVYRGLAFSDLEIPIGAGQSPNCVVRTAPVAVVATSAAALASSSRAPARLTHRVRRDRSCVSTQRIAVTRGISSGDVVSKGV